MDQDTERKVGEPATADTTQLSGADGTPSTVLAVKITEGLPSPADVLAVT